VSSVYEAFSLGDRTATGKVIGDFTIDFCKTMAGAAVSQAGMTLTELGVGKYVLMNPNITERTIISGYLTADSSKSFSLLMDPVDGDIAKDSTVAKEVSLARVLGLVMENHVEDDIVRDANSLKTQSTIYCYDSAANASLHDKATGLVASYTVLVEYTGILMTRLKVVKN